MGKFSFDGYRTHWPRVGGVLAMALGGATTLAARRMTKPQLLSTLNFGALLVHQYEEYEDPGWFPGQFNHGVFKSDQPRNFPLNKTTAVCINTGLAYPFYIAPILFPKQKWLGLAPASFFLHIPLGVSYIRAVKAEGGLTRGDYVKGAVYNIAFAAIAVAGPNFFGRNKHSSHAFTKEQMGPHDVERA